MFKQSLRNVYFTHFWVILLFFKLQIKKKKKTEPYDIHLKIKNGQI